MRVLVKTPSAPRPSAQISTHAGIASPRNLQFDLAAFAAARQHLANDFRHRRELQQHIETARRMPESFRAAGSEHRDAGWRRQRWQALPTADQHRIDAAPHLRGLCRPAMRNTTPNAAIPMRWKMHSGHGSRPSSYCVY